MWKPLRFKVTSSIAEDCNNPGRSWTNFCHWWLWTKDKTQQKIPVTTVPIHQSNRSLSTWLDRLHWNSSSTWLPHMQTLAKLGIVLYLGGGRVLTAAPISLLTEVLLFLSMSSGLSQISKRHIYMKWMDWKKNNSNAILNKLEKYLCKDFKTPSGHYPTETREQMLI